MITNPLLARDVFSESSSVNDGLTLRDYFAARALDGLISTGERVDDLTKIAYQIADSMLIARQPPKS